MLAAQFCPLCGGSNFYEHWMLEYRREWNKCGSCGYMELKKISIERVINKVSPNNTAEPFLDPIDNIKSTVINIKKVNRKKKKNNNVDNSSSHQDNQ